MLDFWEKFSHSIAKRSNYLLISIPVVFLGKDSCFFTDSLHEGVKVEGVRLFRKTCIFFN